jgi:outer membrane protein insertion porin family
MGKLLSKLLLLALLACSVAAQAQVRIGSSNAFSYSAPRTYEIGGMTVEGAENLDEGAIRLLSGLQVGDEIEIPGEETAEAIRKLWKQDLFSDVQLLADRIEGNKIFLIIKIQERPRLSKFKFSGASKSEADDLREKINLYKEKIVTENLVISTRNKVYDYYNDKGFRSALVVVTQEVDSVFRNHVILKIEIDKQKKDKIKHINVTGNHYYSDYQIRRSLKETKEVSFFRPFLDLDTLGRTLLHQSIRQTKKMPLTTWRYMQDHMKVRIFKASKYLKNNFDEDKDKLIAKYNQKGFRDARILNDTIYNVAKHRINLDIELSEGHRYYFRNIKWIGNTKYSSEMLTSTLGIKRGDVYDPVKLEARLYMDQNGGDVTSLYMDNGYLFFQLDPVEILVGKDSIDLEIRMYEGEQARINRVTVSGNTKTNDYVILRELRTRPGQLFSRADIIRSQRELSVLGYFDPEKMNVIPRPDPSTGTVDIEYIVEEKPNDQLTLQGGYGGGILVATVGIQFNNFSTRNILKPDQWNGPLPTGDGQQLSLSYNTNGRQYQAFNLSFTEPWLGGKKPVSFTIGTFYSQFSNGALKRVPSNFEALNEVIWGQEKPLYVYNVSRGYFERRGISMQIGSRLKWPDDYFTLLVEVSAMQYTLQNQSQFFFFSTGQAYNLYGRFKISRNSIDQQIFPTMGSEISLSGQFTPPYSYFNNKDYHGMSAAERFRWLEYHKWKFSAAFYNKVFDKFVLYTKIGLGVMGMYNRDVGMVPFERFYLGGDPFSQLNNNLDSRENISLRGYKANNVSPLDGATLINKYTMELRYPFSLNPSATIYGLAFAEAGNSWSNFSGFNPMDVYKSTGLGVRIFLPMFGLLGVDWAYRLGDGYTRDGYPAFDTQRSRFHFTLGMQFGDL